MKPTVINSVPNVSGHRSPASRAAACEPQGGSRRRRLKRRPGEEGAPGAAEKVFLSMAQAIAVRRVIVSNPQGLHARPAHALAQLANRFQASIQIVKDGEPVDGKSILSILTLAAAQGTELVIRATGPDADAAVDALVALFQQDCALEDSLTDPNDQQHDGRE